MQVEGGVDEAAVPVAPDRHHYPSSRGASLRQTPRDNGFPLSRERHSAHPYNVGIRTRPILVAIGWLLVAAIIWLSLTPRPPDVGAGDKLSHFAAYGTLMLWFAQLYRPTRTRVLYAVGFVIMGIVLEFVQGAVGRTYEVEDMFANTIGVLLGWGVAIILFK